MAVISVTAMTIKPGRYADYLATRGAADEVLKKAGAQNLRLIAALSAGEASGTLVATWEADDWEAYGKVTQNFFTNGGAEVMEGVASADSPIASWQSSTYVDVPG